MRFVRSSIVAGFVLVSSIGLAPTMANADDSTGTVGLPCCATDAPVVGGDVVPASPALALAAGSANPGGQPAGAAGQQVLALPDLSGNGSGLVQVQLPAMAPAAATAGLAGTWDCYGTFADCPSTIELRPDGSYYSANAEPLGTWAQNGNVVLFSGVLDGLGAGPGTLSSMGYLEFAWTALDGGDQWFTFIKR